MKVFSITEEIDKKRETEALRQLDIKASYVLIENCYRFLEMNDLQEIKGLKKHMLQALIRLKELR